MDLPGNSFIMESVKDGSRAISVLTVLEAI